MKSTYLFSLLVLCIALFTTSCQSDESKKIREEARQDLPQAPVTTNTTTAPITATPTGNVPHYQCPDRCEGGVGAAAGACPVCGKEMAHNQAFHNQQPATANPTTPSITTTPSTTTTTTTTTPNPSPAQNAAGVYHYTCAKGCAGGAGSAQACAVCGAALVHNQAYHN
jgi:hypothetical protein